MDNQQNMPLDKELFKPIEFTNEEGQEVQEEEEENDSEDEGIEDYNTGGYHPVHIGEVINKRYVIIQKLGWGHFSTVWLSKDFKYNTYVALKIQKSAPHYLEAAYDEVEILQKVAKQASNPEWIKCLKEYYKDDKKKKNFTRDDCQIVQLLNSFIYQGPYGNHFCMVFEIMSVNLLEIIKRYNYKGIPMHLARIIAKQILIGLDFLHRFCQVIHTDLKPENVLVCLTQEEIKQIVEKGQLNINQKIKERIKKYQIQHNIYIEEQNNDEREEEEIKQDEQSQNDEDEKSNAQNQEEEKKKNDQQNLTKQQKKYQRKKAALKRKKQKLKEEQQKANGIQPNENIKVKIADLGNACWTYHHFATKIQTRQYRSPESIIGMHYDTSADIWSFACMMFEMITGDFLFQPRRNTDYSKNEDHLAQIEELLKKFPLKFSLAIQKAKKIFDQNGNLRKIPVLHYWPLKNVLIEKYQIKQDEVYLLTQFLVSMLKAEPLKRASARQVLLHCDWLKANTNYLFKYTESEFQRYMAKKQLLSYDEVQLSSNEAEDSEIYDADSSKNTSVLQEDDDDQFYGQSEYKFDYKLIDRSFTNLGYIGYGDGIVLEDLDQNANWQFENFKKQK
ncbi:serine protein kinase, putative [Ichthyophthirius multifiliis]|uniref:non-specific serine/threonine protein kinase n=1 Tax=Ichthyophthirius multifiliis TaxID=5932 RepID=G0QZY0_ICHMU|nr:serine protein kinase, putative [Ichthyophthirius multifiliis]EGR29242.1 serine protein kinase, putative [Ichthyophthirius multifiliis]|eukprot:XP_004030478.1 serine protein kinase, putative [Ichthyophthirius multifiliis]